MFDIGWGELLVIGVVALIAIGPKELPSVLRTVGQWMTKLRRMAAEFQGQFQEAIREAEMADLKKEVDEMTATATSYTNFDPIGDVRKDIEKTFTDTPADTTGASVPTSTVDAPAVDTTPPAPASALPPVGAESTPVAPSSEAPPPKPEPAAAKPDDWPEPDWFRDKPGAGGKPA